MKYFTLGVAIVSIALGVIAFFFTPKKMNANRERPQEFIYNGHSYLYFYYKGVVHNPDCKKCLIIFE